MFLRSLLTTSAMCAIAASLHGQAAKQEIKISQVDMKLEQQFTPQINAVNVVDKRWIPKVWLEAQVNFKATIATALGGREGTYPSIDVKYFIALSGVKQDNKQVVLSSSITYKDVAGGDNHTLAYVMPATLKRLLKKENGSKVDVAAFGVEISSGGTVLGGKSSTGSKWWEPADKLVFDDAVLPKDKTPFAPFFGDYDLATASK